MRSLILIFSLFVILGFEPIPGKPVLIDRVNHWQIMSEGKLTTIAYYKKVILPDGTKVELKSKIPLTKEQWQKMADNYWKTIKREEQNKPEPCTHCGGTGIEP